MRRLTFVLALLIVLVGCSDNKSADTTTTTTTTTTSSSTTTTTAPPGPPRCTVDRLALNAHEGDGATGHVISYYTLSNKGTVTCTLHGHPGIQLVDANGQPVPTTVVKGNGFIMQNKAGPSLVTIPAGGEAWFAVESTSQCPNDEQPQRSTAILVIPPDETHQMRVDSMLPYCSDRTVNVSPVRMRSEDV